MNPGASFLVTGATSGIGKAIAERLLEQGCKVIGLGRDFTKAGFESENFKPVELDLADRENLDAAISALLQDHPVIDGLVLAAGQGDFGSLEEFSSTRIQELMQVNFVSQAILVRHCIAGFKQRDAGRIVIIGSESALKGARYGSIYSASKFALRGFAQSLRHECTRHNISVTLINPGMVKSPFFDRLDFKHGEEPGQYILPEQIADTVMNTLSVSPDIVIDEINLSPRAYVVKKKQ